MLIKTNKTLNNESIFLGDIFKFNFQNLRETAFFGSNIGKYLEEEKIEQAYMHINQSEKTNFNIIGYNLICVKDGEIFSETKNDEPRFLNYIMSKNNELTKINNCTNQKLTMEDLLEKNNTDYSLYHEYSNLPIGLKTIDNKDIFYGDIIEVDIVKSKNIRFFTQEIKEILISKKIEKLYLHFLDENKFYYNNINTPMLALYGLSKNGLENSETEEDNKEMQKVYESTGKYKPDNYIFIDASGSRFLENLKDRELIGIKAGASFKKELDLEDFSIKPLNKPKKLKI